MVIEITMTEAAHRQLKTAIWLFLEDKDEVSVHALAAGANELFERICTKRGIFGLRRYMLALFNEAAQKQVVDKLNETKNYFKHGSPNEEAFLFNQDTNLIELIFACMNAGSAGVDDPELRAFLGWCAATNPEFVGEPFKSSLKRKLPPGFDQWELKKQKRFGLEMLRLVNNRVPA